MADITQEDAIAIFRSVLDVGKVNPSAIDDLAAKRLAIVSSRFAGFLEYSDFLELGRVHVANLAIITRQQVAQYKGDVLDSAYLSAMADSKTRNVHEPSSTVSDRTGLHDLRKDVEFITGSAGLTDKLVDSVQAPEDKLASVKVQSSDRRYLQYATGAHRDGKIELSNGNPVVLKQNQVISFLDFDSKQSPNMTIEQISGDQLVVRLFNPRTNKEQFLTVDGSKTTDFGRAGVLQGFFAEFDDVEPYNHISRRHFTIQHDKDGFKIVKSPDVNNRDFFPVVYDRPAIDSKALQRRNLFGGTLKYASVGTDMAHLIDPSTYGSAREHGNIIVALTPDGIPKTNAVALQSHLNQKLFPGKVFRTDDKTGKYIVYVNTGSGGRENIDERKKFVADTIAKDSEEIAFNIGDLPDQSYKAALTKLDAYKKTRDNSFIRLPIVSDDLGEIEKLQKTLSSPPYNIYTEVLPSPQGDRFVLQTPVGAKRDDDTVSELSLALFNAVGRALDSLPSYIPGIRGRNAQVAQPEISAKPVMPPLPPPPILS